MKVSIITVCLNSEATIDRTIRSVISQANVDLEYIIVDGMSIDNNVSNCRKVHVKDIVEYIEGHLPYNVTHEYVEGTPGDQNGVYGANDKIRHDLGWDGKISFEEGMQRMIDWALK